MANKIMPNNLEAEESVLGACFLSKYALQKATESLLPESFYSASNVDYYIQNVEETAILRRLIETANDIATEGYRTDETVNEILDSSEKKILSIVKNRKSSEFRSIKDVLLKTQSDLEQWEKQLLHLISQHMPL